MNLEEELRKCFKCGMCRGVCPVLAEELVETAGPRGKVALCEALHDGGIRATESVLGLLRKCTGCRSCSLNCTSGTDPCALAQVVASEIGSPAIESPAPRGTIGKLLQDARANARKDVGRFQTPSAGKNGAVAYFIGCMEAGRLSKVPENVRAILRELGVDVTVPSGQVCCGWPHVLSGDLESARELALQNERVLSPFQVVLTSCVHCRSTLTQDYTSLFGINGLAARTRDVLGYMRTSGLLGRLNVRPMAEEVFHSHACRMGRGRAKDTSHIEFLRERLPGGIVESERDGCCGAPLWVHAPDAADRMLRRKMVDVERSGCSVVVAECPFCFLAIESAGEVSVRHILAEVRL